ncbi:LOW QUALITY PROTEIN: olfactory receptor 56A1-like [Trachypithecus francoisi]|uniref:LOW QUALITY PROTEIN: olfactory receptor 56A1-like n=1 Tax=Trachypithecus francoisi TaxID=54180 RepID=UPI00141B69E9|nr:LOW QUALITY PROTEIN: olfactory receptor 56A1-like [Trachypithecus francoisi]
MGSPELPLVQLVALQGEGVVGFSPGADHGPQAHLLGVSDLAFTLTWGGIWGHCPRWPCIKPLPEVQEPSALSRVGMAPLVRALKARIREGGARWSNRNSLLCFTVIPKVLAIFWFDLRLISFPACLFQMFIMNSFLPMESCTFMVMAICHPRLWYVAICHPLRYPSIITNQFVAKASVFIVVKNALLTAPIPILTSLLHYCGKNVIENCICANLCPRPVSRLSCDNFTLNRIYQFVAGWTLLGLDFILIFLSYTFILRAVLRFKAEGVAVKALSTCGSHFILILFFSTILLVLVLINVARKKVPMDILILLNVLHYLIPPALNPIVYGVRTKEIKQGIQKLLQRGR